MGARASFWVRCAAIAAAISAPFLPPMHDDGEGRSVVYVIDTSPSMGGQAVDRASDFVQKAWEARGDTKVGVVAFAGKATVTLPVGADGPPLGLLPEHTGGTDVAAALRLARSALPRWGRRRIVLLSDGRPTRGDALAEVHRAAAEGITVDAVPIGASSLGRDAITRLAPREPRVAQGEPVTVTATIRGEPSQSRRVRWSRDGKEVETRPVELDASGEAEVSFVDPKAGPGIHVYRAQVLGGSATFASEAPSLTTAVTVGGKPRVLVLTIDGVCPALLRDALDKAGVDVQIATLPEGMPDAAALSGIDLVVLSDVPLEPSGDAASGEGLTPAAQGALIEYAQKGGGVVVTGGAFGLAPEYAGTPLARMLPVEIEDKGQIEDPKVAMAIMLDRSGSMGAMVGTHNKLQLAVEAALAAASTLRSDDLLAIGSVDEQTQWDEPFGPVSGLAPRREQIRSIDVGGGGILIFTALVDAYRTLNHAPAPVRHVILFADTADSEEQTEDCSHGTCKGDPRTAEELAVAAHKLGVTTSVVGIGRETDSDTPFLRRLAASGGGRFYITGDATDLRRIFVSETRVAARSNLREGPVAVTVSEDHPILAGADLTAMPPLGGFVETRRRATAAVALATGDDDKPILASWRYGLGQVVVLTTDLRADWKSGWSSFSGGGKVLSQMVRFSMRRHSGGNADVRATVGDHGVEVSVDFAEVAGETASPPKRVDAFAVAEDGSSHPLKLGAGLERVAPGRFVARGKTSGEPFVVVRAYDENGGIVGETIGRIDESSELAELGPDERALADLVRAGDGHYAPEPEETLRKEGPAGSEPIPVWPWILLASAALVCVDLWLRRSGRSRPRFALPVGPLAADGPRRAAPELETAPIPAPAEPPAKAA